MISNFLTAAVGNDDIFEKKLAAKDAKLREAFLQTGTFALHSSLP